MMDEIGFKTASEKKPTPRKKPDGKHTPPHYTLPGSGKYDVMDLVEMLGWGRGFRLGNVLKYIARAGRKDDEIADLEKARDYIDREIAARKEKGK